jgi:pimeloyl-ACP methyl ester carboxylesterase
MLANLNYLQLLEAGSKNPNHPLFIYCSGMDGTGELLHLQADGLSKYFDIRCVVIPPDDLNDWDVLTNALIYTIKEILEHKQKKSIYLCGESFGGCLALSVALATPWLLERLILVNPASSMSRSPWLGLGGTLIQYVPEFIHQGATLGFLPFLAALDRMERRDRASLLAAMRTLPPKTVSWRVSLLKKFEIDRHQLSQFTQPVLIVASTGDRLLPSVDEAKCLVNLLPHAKMVTLPNSGHACLLEKDVNLLKIMEEADFLSFQQPKSSK